MENAVRFIVPQLHDNHTRMETEHTGYLHSKNVTCHCTAMVNSNLTVTSLWYRCYGNRGGDRTQEVKDATHWNNPVDQSECGSEDQLGDRPKQNIPR